MSSAGSLKMSDVQKAAAFRVALRSFLRQTEKSAQHAGLTPQRYLLLLLIKGAEDGSSRATISELARRLHLAQSTVTELVNRAAGAGLVERLASTDDARVVYVELTEQGEERFAAAFDAMVDDRRRLGQIVADLSG